MLIPQDAKNPVRGIFKNRGFTFIEVIIAALIISLVAGSVLSAYVGGQKYAIRTKHRIQAYQFAREALDRLRSNSSYGYGSAAMTVADHDEFDVGSNVVRGELATLPPDSPDQSLTYNVTEPVVDGYKKVRISVKWKEPVL